jgi:hypothetical protein
MKLKMKGWLVLGGFCVSVFATSSLMIAMADPSVASGRGRLPVVPAEKVRSELELPGLRAETGFGLDIDPSSVTHVGSFALPSGGIHEVYRAKSRDGWTCILEERPVGTSPNGKPQSIYGGGCSPQALAPHALKVSVSGAGNVDASGAEGLSIVGFAGPAVDRVGLRMSDGTVVPLVLNPSRGFHFSGAAAMKVSPVAVVAFDRAGAKVNERFVG